MKYLSFNYLSMVYSDMFWSSKGEGRRYRIFRKKKKNTKQNRCQTKLKCRNTKGVSEAHKSKENLDPIIYISESFTEALQNEYT
jgi:hypothetical protein